MKNVLKSISVLLLFGLLSLACEPEEVKPVCKVDGATYTAGQSWTHSDGCNTCTCTDSGQVACTKKLCVPKNEFTVTDWEHNPVSYDVSAVSLTVDGDTVRLLGSANRDPIPGAVDDEYADHLSIDLYLPSVLSLALDKQYPLTGTSSWSQAGVVFPDAVSFTPGNQHLPAVTKLFSYRTCFCYSQGGGSQIYKGSVVFSHISKERIAGVVEIWVTGNRPPSTQDQTFLYFLRFDQPL